ncbi:MAG: amidohydrolase [Desulfobacterales bacterium]|nr:amidohydrolase [Desulfobacterales bacterium]
MATPAVIFPAKEIITMNPEQPHARAVAVKDGRILGTGGLPELEYWLKNSAFSDYEINTRFEERVLMPGLVDAHTHVEIQALIYSGYFVAQIPWPDPGGGFFPVYPTKTGVLERLKELDRELPAGQPLFAVAYDENKAGPLTLSDLDQVSATRPVLVANLVFHRFWGNSVLFEKSGIGPGNLPPGIMADDAGKPDGTIIETAGLMAVLPGMPGLFDDLHDKIRSIMPLFTAAGNTTVCDAALGTLGLELSLGILSPLFAQEDIKLRMVGLPWAMAPMNQGIPPKAFIPEIKKAGALATDKFRIGAVKLYTDGSLISKTAPVNWPGYWDGAPVAEMSCTPETIRQWIIALHREGIPTVTHTNTDLGCAIVLDAVEEAQSQCFRPDIRHRMDHCYTITTAQLKKARALGVTVQFFTPQLYYYGDSHLAALGPDRARHLTPVGTASRLGVSWGFHNDPPGTPQLPWTGIHAVVNRTTLETGTLLGENQRVSVEEALRAVTIEAAYQMHLDHEIGSIEFGKKADFCVLEKNPLAVDPKEIMDMPVWGTVFGGEPVKAV